MGDYSATLNLLGTEFPMRASLAKREPAMLEQARRTDLYARVREACKGRATYILHDGPPYANGAIHLGHVVNKTLKDFVTRTKTVLGYDATYVPGWDCHGLPIERELEKQKVSKADPLEFRRRCRAFADSQIAIQRQGFERLGVLGDWDNHYRTMQPSTEADIIRALGALHKTGLIYRSLRPVLHCSVCQSSLAEAEIEYADRVSDSVDVAFAAVDELAVAAAFGLEEATGVAAVIWTTTAWTLPANQCIVANPTLTYAAVRTDKGLYIVAEELVAASTERWGVTGTVAATVSGARLVGLEFRHPFYERKALLFAAEHATAEEGTGLVHTAPSHGEEDYAVGVAHGLKSECPVDPAGRYHAWVEQFAGQEIWEAVPGIIATMRDNGTLLAHHKYGHSYPVCWRHKAPVLFRTSLQWFVAMDHKANGASSLRERSMEAIANTEFFPAWGSERMGKMVAGRPDWCLSRQRMWNSPVAFFVHKETGELHPRTEELVEEVAQKVAERGIEAWFSLAPEELLGEEAADYEKVTDTLDVWFDSGVTHQAVMHWRGGKQNRPDMYLEGSDQHRGWFMSSLMTACALYSEAPWCQVLTHGFVVGGDGRKMSKSLGNALSPAKILSEHGADILRMWVATADYSQEIKLSPEILRTNIDSYRLLRNRIRFLLANLSDFNYAKDAVPLAELAELDRYILVLAEKRRARIYELFDRYSFHVAMQELHDFCNIDLGRFYFDIIKDRLYTLPAASWSRRSAQTSMHHLTMLVLVALGPILPYTADEAWQVFTKDAMESTMFHTLERLPEIAGAEVVVKRWDCVRTWRGKVSKTIEQSRASKKVTCPEVELHVRLQVPQPDHAILATLTEADLASVLLVSSMELVLDDETAITVSQATNDKCMRCWRRAQGVGSTLEAEVCTRCQEALAGRADAGRQV